MWLEGSCISYKPFYNFDYFPVDDPVEPADPAAFADVGQAWEIMAMTRDINFMMNNVEVNIYFVFYLSKRVLFTFKNCHSMLP